MTVSPLPSITQGDVCWETLRSGVRLTETIHAAHTRLDEHAHHEASLSLVLYGSFEERVGDDRFLCGPMSLLYKPPGAPHSNRYGPSGARTLLVALDPGAYRRLARVLPKVEERALRADRLLEARGLSLLVAGRNEDRDPPPDWEELFAEVLGREVRDAGADAVRPYWLDRVDELIHERFAEPLGLSFLAEEVGVHPVHLARVFRRHHGRSIGEAIRRKRVEQALARLRTGASGLAQLALECGFADQSHLTREFDREVGLTPGRFRRRALGLLDGAGPRPDSP